MLIIIIAFQFCCGQASSRNRKSEYLSPIFEVPVEETFSEPIQEKASHVEPQTVPECLVMHNTVFERARLSQTFQESNFSKFQIRFWKILSAKNLSKTSPNGLWSCFRAYKPIRKRENTFFDPKTLKIVQIVGFLKRLDGTEKQGSRQSHCGWIGGHGNWWVRTSWLFGCIMVFHFTIRFATKGCEIQCTWDQCF